MRRVVKWGLISLLVAVAFMFVAGFGVPLFFPWTEWNCEHQEVDLRTARLRYVKYFMLLKLSDRVVDSAITRVLPPERLVGVVPEWRRVNTFSPGVRNSPHYIFHSAFSQIHHLQLIWEMAELPAEVRRKTALHVLALWQHGSRDDLADRYIGGLRDLMDESKRGPLIESILRLEMPEVRTEGGVVTHTVFYPSGQPMDRVQGRVDAPGHFVRDGIWESWHPDGKREVYGHYQNGLHHGRRFEWNRDGKLSSIIGFTHDELTEYETENLERHPDYKVAEQLNTP